VSFGRRLGRLGPLLGAALLAGVVVLAACGSPRYHYVKNKSDQTFVRVPHNWTLFDEDDLLRQSDDSPEAKAVFKQRSWSVAFDAAPRPSPANLLTPSKHPWGLVQVRTLLPEERDNFSLSNLRGLLLGFDPLANEARAEGAVEVLEAREVNQSGLNGSELLVNLRTQDGELVKWRQIALMDSKVRKAHILAISCDAACYNANEKVINQVIDSWKVKER
jgi:hypothetical protein